MFLKVKFVTVVGLNLKKECARGKGGGSSGGREDNARDMFMG